MMKQVRFKNNNKLIDFLDFAIANDKIEKQKNGVGRITLLSANKRCS